MSNITIQDLRDSLKLFWSQEGELKDDELPLMAEQELAALEAMAEKAANWDKLEKLAQTLTSVRLVRNLVNPEKFEAAPDGK